MRRSPLKPGKGFRPRLPRGKARMSRAPFRRDAVGSFGGIKRDPRHALGTKKPEPGSRADLEKRLECFNARYVKLRDGFRCRQWGDPKIKCAGQLDCGHIYPKGQFPGGKYLTVNLIAQCRAHNTAHVSQPSILFNWYTETHPPGALTALHRLVLSMPRRMSPEWLSEQIEERERQIAELEAHYEAMV